MSREVVIPARTVKENIVSVEEAVGICVRVVVGVLDAEGNFDLSIPTKEYRISGNDLQELNGEPTAWAPDKPAGTYRNDDLWHYIDLQRAENA